MNLNDLSTCLQRYPELRIAVVGDFFLDRYLLIDPTWQEVSIETGLPVHNVVEIRAQPGAAGTIVANLAALKVGRIVTVGFRGDDGEGFELDRSLRGLKGVDTTHLLVAPDRRTPVYCKPLVLEPGGPRELNRLDAKNRTPTPAPLRRNLADRLSQLAGHVDALILLDQVDLEGTGVVGPEVAQAAAELARQGLLIVADSRRGLAGYPPLAFKMNVAELARMTRSKPDELSMEKVQQLVSELAEKNRQPVFVTLAERGIVASRPGEPALHVAALPVRGPIDVVGAGDSVAANLATALAAGCDLRHALTAAMAASSVVIHQIGTTGTASPDQILELLRQYA